MTNPPVAQQLELPGMTSHNTPPAAASKASSRASAFTELGFQATIAALQEEIRALYLADTVPWIVGYSGGKDSTATLQLILETAGSCPL